MKKKIQPNKQFTFFTLFLYSVFFFSQGQTKIDSVGTKIKKPKHYFSNLIFTNYYSSKERTLGKPATQQGLNVYNRLKTLQYSQINSGFLFPLITKEKINNDSSSISNWHFLLTGNFLNAFPVFSGLENQHIFCRYSIGTRSMYNNGKKDVFFFDFSPFMAFDYNYSEKKQIRLSNTFLWSHIFSERFSFRLGYTRSYIFGDRLLLPLIGFRLGKLDGSYMSFQFPKNLTINLPLKRSLSFNLLVKPVGNVFDFKDHDSLYYGANKKLILGWRDICLGTGLDYHPNRFISLFVHIGVATQRSSLVLYSKAANENNKVNSYKWFYYENLERGAYLNLGFSFRFGETKISGGNFNINELNNINTENDPGNTNAGSNYPVTPAGSKGINSSLKINDLNDILSDVDLYD
jgi:hypothetical protein